MFVDVFRGSSEFRYGTGFRGGGTGAGVAHLVLHAGEFLLLRGVELLLARRVRVEVLADLGNDFLEVERVLGDGRFELAPVII